jgi:hypothetical protein
MEELWNGVQEVIADTALLLGCVPPQAAPRRWAEDCARR